MEEIPIIVRNDPWLEPQTESINRRTRRFEEALAAIRAKSGSLAAYACGHKYSGIHFNAITNEWTTPISLQKMTVASGN